MAFLLQDLGKCTSNANKIVVAAENSYGKLTKSDAELMDMNLERLRASLEEAERVITEKPKTPCHRSCHGGSLP